MSRQKNATWHSGDNPCTQNNISQHNQNNRIGEKMSGYAMLIRPTPNSNQLENLPTSWLKSCLGEVINYGKVEKAKPCEIQNNTWVLELEDIEKNSSKIIQRLTFADRQSKSTKNRFRTGDVLYGKLRPYLNKVVIADSDGVCTTEIIPLNGNGFLNNRYLFYWFKHPAFLSYVAHVGYGVNMPRLGSKDGIAAPFILAPLAEQKVIADKLDTLLAQVENSKARLERIPQILKRFRQSVLAAAVTGKLTEEWRGQSEYIDTKIGFEIPKSWTLLTIEDFAEVKGGKRLPKGEELIEEDTGLKYIRAGQLKNGTIIRGSDARNKQLYITPNAHQQIKRYIVSEGDAYLTIVGASIGDAGVVPREFDGANLTENAAKLCDFKQPISSSYMGYWLRSQYIQDLIRLEIKSGAQGKLALKRIKTLPFPKVSIEEQTEIVTRVEQLFDYADTIERQVQNALARVNNLSQAIFAKAFRGELTEQWRQDNPDLISGDNSAEALLVKIKAEREAMQPKKKTHAKKMTA